MSRPRGGRIAYRRDVRFDEQEGRQKARPQGPQARQRRAETRALEGAGADPGRPLNRAADGSGTTLTRVLPETTAATIRTRLEAAIEPDALLVTDGAIFLPPCARSLGVTHEPVGRKAGERRRGDLHLNTTRSSHERLETLRGHRAVATSFLGGDLAWYHLAILPKLPTPRSVLTSIAGLTPAGVHSCANCAKGFNNSA